jgi:hypothetical protein
VASKQLAHHIRSDATTITDFTSQISDPEKLGTCKTGSFGDVFQCTVETSSGQVKVCPSQINGPSSSLIYLTTSRSQ